MATKSNYPDFVDLIREYDLIGIQESKTDDTDLIDFPGYNIYYNNRENLSRRKSGGIVLLVKTELEKYVEVDFLHSSKLVLWCKISHEILSTDKDVYCGVVYIPPIGSKYANEEPYVELQREILRKCPDNSHIILMGDFNSRTGEKPDFLNIDEYLSDKYGLDFLQSENSEIIDHFYKNKIPLQRKNPDKIMNSYGTQMIELCKMANLYILNGRIGQSIQNSKYTCKDKSVIDYFLSSACLFNVIKDFRILNFSNLYSDAHCPVSVSLHTQGWCNDDIREELNLNVNTTKLWNPEKSTIFLENFDRLQISDIELRLSSLSNNESLCQADVDNIVTDIGKLFESCAAESFGQVRPERNIRVDNSGKPWFNRDCRQMRNQYHYARRVYSINKTEHNKQFLKQVSKSYKDTMHLSIRRFKMARTEKLRKLKSSNPREYWKILNSNDKKSECQVPLNDLYNYFKHVNSANTNASECPLINNNNSNDNNEELNMPINEFEVQSAIKQLKNNKSPGIDNIKNEHIKNTSQIMIPLYTKLFNLIFDTAIIPKSWSIGVIKPIYKNKGDPSLPENYRPITILSCLGKLFTLIINNRLKCYAEKYSILESCQAGFRKKSFNGRQFIYHQMFN